MNVGLMQLLTKERDTCLLLIREARTELLILPANREDRKLELGTTISDQTIKYNNLCISLKQNATNRQVVK